MGNQESRISNYNIKSTLIENDYFSVLDAVSKKDNSNNVSIFKHKNKLKLSDKVEGTEDIENILFKNAIQRIKTIRHPGIVRFRDADIYSETPAIITENVIPLNSVLKDITPENLCTGIFNLLKTIEFLHQSCKLVYNNICLESIFVPRNNYTKWLIGEFQYSIPINTSKSESQKIIEKIPSRLQPSKDDKEVNGFHRDYWLIGKLIEEIIKPYSSKKDKKGTNINWIQLQQIALQMQDSNPQNRKSVTEAINEPFFNNNIVIEVLEYIKNYKIKDETERKNCLSILPGKMKLMSKDILEKNIIPEIIQKEIINDSFSDILFSEIFKDTVKGNAMASEEYYKKKIIPYILETIKLHQWGTRIVLLKLIDNYYDAIIRYDTEENKSRELIITEILVGLEDMDQDIYLNSFNALTKILMRTNLKNENNNQINDKNNDETLSTAGSRKNSNINDKPPQTPNEKNDNSYLNTNTLINRFIIPHFIRMQISDNYDNRMESLRQVVDLWKHFIHIEKDDLEVGQTAKTINLSILKTMKFIIKLFKEDELSLIFNDIFLKNVLNKPDTFGYYYVSSYIMPLLVTHLPRATLNIRNSEISILHNLLNYLSNCPENNLITEDTSTNVKKLKNMYSNKFQTLEKYHFVKAGPVRKAERTLSKNNINSASSTSLNLSSRSNSRNDLSENINKKESFDIPKNSNKTKENPVMNKETSDKTKDMEWENENDDFENNEIINSKDNNIKSATSPKSKPVPASSAWDNFNDKSNKVNDGWNFDWSDSEENDDSMNIKNDEKQEFEVVDINKEKFERDVQSSDKNTVLEVKEENNKPNEPIAKNPIVTGAAAIGSLNKSSSMKSMKLGKKKENKESSLKKKLSDLNKMQKLKSQKKKEDDIKSKEIEDIMSLISNDSPNTSSKSNSVLSLNNMSNSKSSSSLKPNNVDSDKKNKILSDFNSITNEETDLINSGWDDLDDLEGPEESKNWTVDKINTQSKPENTNKQITDGWGDFNISPIKEDWNNIPNLNEANDNLTKNTTTDNNEKNAWDFNNDFEIPEMKNLNETPSKENKPIESGNAWDFNNDFNIPEFEKPKDNAKSTESNNAWDFNNDFEIPKMPEIKETTNVKDQPNLTESWDFNDDFSIPEIKPVVEETKKEEKSDNEPTNSWEFNDDFSIPEIKEEKKSEEPVVEEIKKEEEIKVEEKATEHTTNSWEFNDNFEIPEIKEEKKPEESVVEEKPSTEPASSWEFNDDFNIPEIKEENKPEESIKEETKKEESIVEQTGSWEFNDNFDIPEINEDKKVEVEETIKEEEIKIEEPVVEEKVTEPSSSWEFNDDLEIPEIKEEEKPVVEEQPKEEDVKVEEPVAEEQPKEEVKADEPIVEEQPKEEVKVEEPVAEEQPKEEEVKAEEPVVEEQPKEEEVKVEEPVVEEQPKEEEVKVEEPVEEQPKEEEIEVEEPIAEEQPKEEEVKAEEPVVEEQPKEEEVKAEEPVAEEENSWDFNDNLDIPEIDKKEETVIESEKKEQIPEIPETREAVETNVTEAKNEEDDQKPDTTKETVKEVIINDNSNGEFPDDVEIIEEVIEVVNEVDQIDPNNPHITETVEVVEELIEVKDGDRYETISRKTIEPESPTKFDDSKINGKNGKSIQKEIKEEIITEEIIEEDATEDIPVTKEEEDVKVDDLLNLDGNASAPAAEVKNDVMVDDLLNLDVSAPAPAAEVKNDVMVDDLLNLDVSAPAPAAEVKNDVMFPTTKTAEEEKEKEQEETDNPILNELKNSSNEMHSSNSWDFNDDLEIPDIDTEKKD
ncbi:hypothetical protein PIROE2DRAFT_1175 [Piromyces sp. E2]|nr:hypothetical protein PIROE2DRAFT_1175 [Piromyces sp. E2]|eukprot:OUM70645.1 hypothetical protein PIROE2DRAFT_1175 [Piromyces sp. E2]